MTRPHPVRDESQAVAAQAVIFDIDGTLATGSFAQVYALGATGERVFGYTAQTELVDGQPYLNGHHVAGWVDGQCLELLATLAGRDWDTCRDEALTVYAEEYARVIANGGGVGELVPGVREMLARLRAGGVPVGLSTGNAAAVARRKLAALGIADYFTFDPAAGFGDLHLTRGDVAVAAIAALPPARTVYLVGDTPADMRAAVHAGAYAVGVRSGSEPEAALWAAGAHSVLPDASGLDDLLADTENLRSNPDIRTAP